LALLWFFLWFSLTFGSFPPAQAQPDEPYARQVIRTQQPDDPEVLKEKESAGRFACVPDCWRTEPSPTSIFLGGNPVLAESAAKAVMMWKYAPAAASNNQIVTFTFRPR
jgi:hypothetical protein